MVTRIFETIYFLLSSQSLPYPPLCSVIRTEPQTLLEVINSARDTFIGISRGTCYPCENRTAPCVSVLTVLIKIQAGRTYRGDESNMKRQAFEHPCRYCSLALLVDLCVYRESSISSIKLQKIKFQGNMNVLFL